MLKTEFFLENLIELFDSSGVLLSYGGTSDMSLRDILEYHETISIDDKRELFLAGIDLLESRTFLRILSSEDAKSISTINSDNIRKVFQDFRDLLDDLLSDGSVLRDYRPNFEIIKKLRESYVNPLKVLEGGKV